MAEREKFVWTANLSNGETYSEESLTVPGELSAYQKLLAIMKDKVCALTGWRFQKDGVTHNAPSFSPKAKFPSTVPFTLDYRRKAWQTYHLDGRQVEDFFCRYIVRAKGLKISLFIEDSTGDTWMQLEEAENGT